MSPHSTARAAWLLWAVIVALLITLLIAADFDVVLVAFVIFVLAFSTVGALVASRPPGNPIGWIMSGAAFTYIVGGLSLVYGDMVAHTGPIPQSGIDRAFSNRQPLGSKRSHQRKSEYD